MKKQKRNPLKRAYTQGFKAAIEGRSMDICPHQMEAKRFHWLSGWREGRHNHWQGMTGIASIHTGLYQ